MPEVAEAGQKVDERAPDRLRPRGLRVGFGGDEGVEGGQLWRR